MNSVYRLLLADAEKSNHYYTYLICRSMQV